MKTKIYDIPFLTRSNESDFSCRDGEIASCLGASFPDLSNNEISSINPDEIKPEVSFALVRDTLPGWHIRPDVYPSREVVATDSSMEYWNKMGAQVLAQFVSEALETNRFVSPFYAMAVWKTYDGKFLAPSRPVLLISNSTVPVVATDGDTGSTELTFKIAGAVCSLRLKMPLNEKLRDLTGIIESLEIWVSEPIHDYDSFHSFVPQRNVTTDSWCECLDLNTGVIARERICTETLKLAWKANLEVNDNAKLKFFRHASIPLRDVDLLDEWTAPSAVNLSSGYSDKVFHKFEEISGSSGKAVTSKEAPIEGTGERVEIETRVIKLSGAGELKMAGKVMLRGHYNPVNITIKIYGSRDMADWWCIGRRTGGMTVMLPRSFFRFYKVKIEGILHEKETLEGLNFYCFLT